MIGWDEVLSDNIDPETVIMSWRGLGRGVKAVKQNHPVIFSSNGHFYLNNYQSSNMENEPAATGGLVLMQKLYSTEIVTPEMTDKDVEKILGAEACLWVLTYLTTKRWIIKCCPDWPPSPKLHGAEADGKIISTF